MFYHYFDKIIETVTEVKALQDICLELAPIFVLNIFPDVTRAVLRGVIKALTLQSRVVVPQLFAQLVMNTILIYYLAFKLEMGMIGLWLSKSCVDTFISLYYLILIQCADWEKQSLESVKRQVKD